ncbi:hypothetical protein ACE1CI_16005 [Aerosakkonemataceae cyanobacterium BLCC-F50]|uniref:Uncharacterized protein n=1 Tax=Floridaenema flaviceps BLCC-F50 TaxID=3153642 RepID=A0ABV4XRU3_9CYAN
MSAIPSMLSNLGQRYYFTPYSLLTEADLPLGLFRYLRLYHIT